MKNLTLFLLLTISISTYGQVEVELFSEQINGSALSTTSPSMNSQENRLCFKKQQTDKKEMIMISDKDADGKWSEPYVALQVNDEFVFQGCALSPDGKRIYFDMDNDLYMIDYVSEKKWSKPQKLKAISDDVMECRPSISGDGQTLSFIRNVKSSQHPDSDFVFTPYTSSSVKGKDGWAPPNKLRLEMKGDEELQVFNYRGDKKLCFYSSGSMLYGWGNFYGMPDATGGLTAITKIDFNGGFIVWVNEDYTRGLIVTATTPSKIAAIKFSKDLTEQMVAVKAK